MNSIRKETGIEDLIIYDPSPIIRLLQFYIERLAISCIVVRGSLKPDSTIGIFLKKLKDALLYNNNDPININRDNIFYTFFIRNYNPQPVQVQPRKRLIKHSDLNLTEGTRSRKLKPRCSRRRCKKGMLKNPFTNKCEKMSCDSLGKTFVCRKK